MGRFDIALVALAYVIGMFPSAHLVGRVTGHDPTSEGSKNPGASNVYRVAGRLAGVSVLVLDVLKGFGPALAGLAIGGRPLGVACGVAAVLGHVLPIGRRFRGGKGVATLGGFVLVLWPVVAVSVLAIWIVVVTVTKRASVGALVSVPLIPIGVAIGGGEWWEVAAVAATCALVVVRHHRNLGRLIRREEDVLPAAVGSRSSVLE